MDLITFWQLTPYEFGLKIKAYNKRKAEDQEEKIILAYLGAYWQRVRRLPSIKKILGKQQARKEMTAEEMLKIVHELNAAFGGEVIGSSEESDGQGRC